MVAAIMLPKQRDAKMRQHTMQQNLSHTVRIVHSLYTCMSSASNIPTIDPHQTGELGCK